MLIPVIVIGMIDNVDALSIAFAFDNWFCSNHAEFSESMINAVRLYFEL